jgi:hypothetical protein
MHRLQACFAHVLGTKKSLKKGLLSRARSTLHFAFAFALAPQLHDLPIPPTSFGGFLSSLLKIRAVFAMVEPKNNP